MLLTARQTFHCECWGSLQCAFKYTILFITGVRHHVPGPWFCDQESQAVAGACSFDVPSLLLWLRIFSLPLALHSFCLILMPVNTSPYVHVYLPQTIYSQKHIASCPFSFYTKIIDFTLRHALDFSPDRSLLFRYILRRTQIQRLKFVSSTMIS